MSAKKETITYADGIAGRPWRVAVRKFLKAGNSVPIEITDGRHKPRYEGEPYHCRTLSGDLIVNPCAYRYGGYNVYPSTLKIVVGLNWKPQRTT